MKYFYAQWLTTVMLWDHFLSGLDVQVECSFPYPAACKSEGLPTRTDGNSFLLVIQRKRKAFGNQVGPGSIAETFRFWPSDKFNCSGLFWAAADRSNIPSTYFPFITWHSTQFSHAPPVLATNQSGMTYWLAERWYLKLTQLESEVAREEF